MLRSALSSLSFRMCRATDREMAEMNDILLIIVFVLPKFKHHIRVIILDSPHLTSNHAINCGVFEFVKCFQTRLKNNSLINKVNRKRCIGNENEIITSLLCNLSWNVSCNLSLRYQFSV